MDTSTLDESMSVEVNANLGKGSDMTRMIALQGIKQDQQLFVTQMGSNNPICGIQEMLNTQTDILALANVKNVGRYFKTPTPAADAGAAAGAGQTRSDGGRRAGAA